MGTRRRFPAAFYEQSAFESMLVEMKKAIGIARGWAVVAGLVVAGCAPKTATPARPPSPAATAPVATRPAASNPSQPATARAALGTITEQGIRAHMEFLASDALNGRGSGTRD